MQKHQFQALFADRMLLLDGATGTQMMKRGMPAGVCPELWTMAHPEVLQSVQRAYVEAGSNAVYTFTFGGSRFKLASYGAADRTREINAALAKISREAVGPEMLVGGDLAPCGRMLLPYGDTPFEEVVEGFKEQVRGLLDGGVDFFVVETMMDLQEARAALLAVRELCELPVVATMTFERGMHTLTGTDPAAALVALQALGADAVGTNCSTGPAEMVAVIQAMKPFAKVPLVAKANAGKPRLVDGRTVFDMDADTYAAYVTAFADAGVSALGGCCGTDPGFIAKLAAAATGIKPQSMQPAFRGYVSAMRRAVTLGDGAPLLVIGNQLHPNGNADLADLLAGGDMDDLYDIARDQMDEDATALLVAATAPGIDETTVLREMTRTVAQAAPVPLVMSSATPSALEPALREYAGRAVLYPIPGVERTLDWMLPLAAKYGAMVVLAPTGAAEDLPLTLEARMALLERLLALARVHGLSEGDVLVDVTAMVPDMATNDNIAADLLAFLKWVSGTRGLYSLMNLTPMLPNAPAWNWLDERFMAEARKAGLACIVGNPSSALVQAARNG